MSSPTIYFQAMRWRLARNSLRELVTQAWIRLFTILLCSAIIWGLLFIASWKGFYELRVRWDVPLEFKTIELVFALLFFTLAALLTFSTGIILYSSLFASQESHFLLASPVPDDHVFAYKLQGAVGFSSWAFVLLGSPVLIAYGLEVRGGAPWYFYAVLPLFFFGFVLIPGSVGAAACLFLVNVMPRHRWQFLLIILIALLAAGGLWGYYIYQQTTGIGPKGSRLWFESLLAELGALDARMLPFNWVARGLRAAALGDPAEMLYLLGLVWSHGLFCYLIIVMLARRLYRRGYNRVASGGSLRRRYGNSWLDSVVDLTLFFLEPQTKLLIIKDFRTFRRDPAQWAQVLIFLALSAFYFFNMRRFYEQDLGRNFKNGISLLTLTATSFLMCAYSGRFIFPMLSLEGRKFWILGLLPFDRSRLVWGKFAFSAAGCVIVGEFLVLFSNLMLSMPWLVLLMHGVTIFLLALGLSGLSVGLGACLPNFRETDPSKIAVGFGGTLNLVAGILLLIVLVLLMAVPIHLIYSVHPDAPLFPGEVPLRVWLAYLCGIVLGSISVILPLKAGIKQLRRMEF